MEKIVLLKNKDMDARGGEVWLCSLSMMGMTSSVLRATRVEVVMQELILATFSVADMAKDEG